jgi:hypothetical protein
MNRGHLHANAGTGKTSAAWRFFEAVPQQLSEFRTPEAGAVADRHLRFVI